jgi:hypothetical protein
MPTDKMKNVPSMLTQADRTPEERRAIGHLGGTAAGIARKKRKSMQEIASFLLTKNIEKGRGDSPEDFEDLATLTDKNIDAGTAIVLSQIQKAIQGDTQSAVFVRDTVGDKAAEKIEQGITIEDYVREHKPKF